MDASDIWKPIVILIALILLVPMLMGGLMMMPMGPWMMGGGWNPWWAIAMLLLWTIIIAGIGVALVAALRAMPWSRGPAQETPLDILKRRYAKGEISREEYERMKQELQS